MDTGAALLRAILTDPADETARLVYADWLDENGQPERAEFVRVQIWFSKKISPADDRVICGSCLKATQFMRYTKRCRGEVCRKRMREYYSSCNHLNWDWCGGVDGGWAPLVKLSNWSRGFVAHVSCTQSDFLRHAEALFRAQPVTAVTLSDRTPYHARIAQEWFWIHSNSPEISPTLIADPLWSRSRLSGFLGIHRRAKHFDSEAEAREALSLECVDYGRELAGLPALHAPSRPSSVAPASAPVGWQ